MSFSCSEQHNLYSFIWNFHQSYIKKKVPSNVFIWLGSLWYGFNIVVHLLTLFKIHVFAVEIILESTEKPHGVKYPASKGKCKSMTSDLVLVPKLDKLILKKIKYFLTWDLPNHLPSGSLYRISSRHRKWQSDLFPSSKFAYKEFLSLIMP